MIYFPILGALALATGTILEKIVLKGKKVGIRIYLSASFMMLVLAMLPFIYFFWKLESQALKPINLFIFGLVVVFSIIANLFSFYSLKWEKINNIEPARVLEPLFVILLAILFSFFFQNLYDRNFNIIIPALIAGIALLLSHLKKHHLKFNKYFIAAVLGSLFFALELVITRLILDYYSPITFYFLRCAAIFLISLAIFKPNFKDLDKKTSLQILAIGFIYFFYRVIVYYGYLNFGVVFTTLMIMLGPIFVYIFAWKFLKEKLNWKNIIASLVIIACIIYAIVF